MVRVKHYKQIIAAIILAGIMVMIALRISDITSWLGKTLEAFVPLVVGACIAFVLDILIVRYERFILPKKLEKRGRIRPKTLDTGRK